eukprot:gene834-493_t
MEEAADEVDAPLVFQCRGCRAIVGDSFSWVCSDPELNSITLKAGSPNVAEDAALNTSQAGKTPLTYSVVTIDCNTTARKLDPIRDLATLDIDAITSYKLGAGISDGGFDEELLEIPTAHNLRDDITKIQTMILVLSDRLEAIETRPEAAAAETGNGSGSSGSSGGSGAGGGKRARTNKQGRR